MRTFTPLADRLLDLVRYPNDWSREWPAALLAVLIVLLLTAAVSWFATRVASRALRRLAARTTTDLDDRIIGIAEEPMRRLIVGVGLYLAVLELPVPATVGMFLSGAVVLYIVFIGVRVATRVTLVLVLAYGHRVDDAAMKQRFERDYVPLLQKVVGTVFGIIGLIAVVHHFGQNVSSLVATLGIGGLAIGLAAKETLGNMFAGFTILVDRPFRPGDRIKIATGEIGDVLEVGTRSTRLRLLDHNMLIVPNAELVNTRVVNYNFPTSAFRATLEIGVAYGSDVDKVKALILEIIVAQPEALKDPAPTVFLSAFADSAVTILGLYLISEFADAGKVQDRVRVAVYRRFQEAGVKIPFPTREIVLPKS